LSDQDRDESSLKEQVVLLQNALKRERNAKRKLETKLEEKEQKKFEQNKAFFQAYENANNRQIQLQFLFSLTSDIFTLTNIDQMMAKFLANISTFLEPCNAFILAKENNRLSLTQLHLASEKFKSLSSHSTLSTLFNSLKELNTDSFWKRVELKKQSGLVELEPFTQHDTLLFYPLQLTETKMRYLILDIDHYCYSDDFKQTLNTASSQFSMAVKRRIAEIELSYNYQKLQSTLKQLKSTQHQLVHSEKMASLGQLSAGIAHEINNPLGYITSNFEILNEYCQLFEQTFIDVEKQAPEIFKQSKALTFARNDSPDLISSCIKGVKRISEIVSSLKTFSRKDEGDFTLTNINDVIENSLKVVWNQLKYSHKVDTKLVNNIPQISGNEGQLQQVFINLFINAAQAMKENGQLTVVTNKVDDYVEVSVSDTGCGMEQATIRKLFEPFFTTKQEQNGTGLGLSVSYAILEKHQALVSVNSELGVGSTFTIRFPLLPSL